MFSELVCVDAVLISGSVDNAVIIIGVDCEESDEKENDEDDCDDDNEESDNKDNNDDCGELVSVLGLEPNVIIEVDSLIEDESYLVVGSLIIFIKKISKDICVIFFVNNVILTFLMYY